MDNKDINFVFIIVEIVIPGNLISYLTIFDFL